MLQCPVSNFQTIKKSNSVTFLSFQLQWEHRNTEFRIKHFTGVQSLRCVQCSQISHWPHETNSSIECIWSKFMTDTAHWFLHISHSGLWNISITVFNRNCRAILDWMLKIQGLGGTNDLIHFLDFLDWALGTFNLFKNHFFGGRWQISRNWWVCIPFLRILRN